MHPLSLGGKESIFIMTKRNLRLKETMKPSTQGAGISYISNRWFLNSVWSVQDSFVFFMQRLPEGKADNSWGNKPHCPSVKEVGFSKPSGANIYHLSCLCIAMKHFYKTLFLFIKKKKSTFHSFNAILVIYLSYLFKWGFIHWVEAARLWEPWE